MNASMASTIRLSAVLLLLFASACSSHSDAVVEEDQLSGKLRIAIEEPFAEGRVHQLDHSVRGMIYDQLFAFQAKHPDLDIEVINISFTTGSPSTIPQVPLPDIMEVVPYQLKWIANPNEWEDLDALVQNLDLTMPYEQLIDRTRVNGTARMLPISNEPVIDYYDEQVFSQLDIPIPDDNWTWEDFVSASRRLAEEDYVTSIPDNFDVVEPIIQGLGGAYTSEDSMHFAQFMDSESTVDAFNRYVSDMRVQRYKRLSTNGYIALGMGRPSELYSLLDDNSNLRIARMPLFADGKRHNTIITSGLAISTESTNKAAAEAFLKELASNGEDAMSFANFNTLSRRNHKFSDSPLVQQDELLRVMELETANSVPATFQLNPDVINNDGILNLHPDQFGYAFPKLFEPDTIKPILQKLTDTVESLFPDQRGKW